MPDYRDAVWTAALQLVHDEYEARAAEEAGDGDVAEYLRQHKVGHVRAVLELAEDYGRKPTARSTILPDGVVVVAISIRPEN